MRKVSAKIKLDDSPIQKLSWEIDGHHETLGIGMNGITRFFVVEQFLGEYSIIWIEAWKEDKIAYRFNAMNVDTIYY